LKVGETLRLAGQGQVRVTLLAKSGRRARLAIEADAGVEIRPDPAGDAPTVAVAALGRETVAAVQAPYGPDPRRYVGVGRTAKGISGCG
jgi:hypothetical protein